MMPDDIETLRTALAAEQLARREAEARASGAEAMVAHLKLLIAKLKHERFGASSERGHKLLDQMELELEELEAAAAEDASATVKDTVVEAFSTSQTDARATAGTSAAGTRGYSRSCGVSVLWRQAGQAWRDDHRDARSHPTPVEGGADGAREVHLPRLRGHHAATSPIPSHRARQSGTEPAGHDPDRQVL